MIQASTRPPLSARTHTGPVQDRILDALQKSGLLTPADIDEAREAATKDISGYSCVYHLVALRKIAPEVLTDALGRYFGVPTVNLSDRPATAEAIRLVPATLARELFALPIAQNGRTLEVAVLDPYALEAINRIRAVTHLDVQTLLADEYSLHRALQTAYSSSADLEVQVGRAQVQVLGDAYTSPALLRQLDLAVENAEIPKLVDQVLEDGVRRKASDIHFEFFENYGCIRYRIDGHLVEINRRIDPRIGADIVNRIKVKADLNTSQDRVPDDGTTNLIVDGQRFDFRVSTLPTVTGEMVVLRVLERNALFKRTEDLGMRPKDEHLLRMALRKPQGMVLVTGPTGSGKSTTLYTALGVLNQPHRKILTVEDPVERRIEGIAQVQVQAHEEHHLNRDYARVLRAFLRQDPNVIMVGEIRDTETAQIALRAAMTGHLMLSTLHTLDTATTVTRLLDIGVEAFNISTALTLIIAQRLVRRVCPRCKEPHTPTRDEVLDTPFTSDELDGVQLYRGAGCEECNGTGYRGRIGIYEVLSISREIKNAIARAATDDQIREIAIAQGMTTLHSAGLDRLKEGVTTLAEVATETNF